MYYKDITKASRLYDANKVLAMSYCCVVQEAPCGDFVTHLFCHLCANCQEYREIRERSGSSPDLNLAIVTAPPVQKMESASESNAAA
ncbi:hypothetical protein L484_027989 [Morus notabilis]|uniref:Uncharacterized protein n=1 Tax=Morus notabilis TaxID=981085 RepID=W9S7N8_9ROSA|nr:hypothetical protein L484_027989 [Morus notabilis]